MFLSLRRVRVEYLGYIFFSLLLTPSVRHFTPHWLSEDWQRGAGEASGLPSQAAAGSVWGQGGHQRGLQRHIQLGAMQHLPSLNVTGNSTRSSSHVALIPWHRRPTKTQVQEDNYQFCVL